MRPEDLILVSVDDHLIEPPDLFDGHVPAKYKDLAPRVVNEPGADTWVFGDVRAKSIGLNAVASWPKEEWGFDPVGFAEMRPGCYDVGALRALATDVDTGIRSRAEFREMFTAAH